MLNTIDVTIKIEKEKVKMLEMFLIQNGDTLDELINNWIGDYLVDSMQKTISLIKKEPMKPVETEKIYKAVRKIPIWAGKPNQISSQVIRAYLTCNNRNLAKGITTGIVNKDDMREEFYKNNPDKINPNDGRTGPFDTNLSSMQSETGNNHGLIFRVNGPEVSVSEVAKDVLHRYQSHFLKD